MSKIKILYLDHAPYEGGAEVSLKELVARLDKERFTPVVVAPTGSPYLEELVQSGIECVEFEFHWCQYAKVFPLIGDLVKLTKLVSRLSPDIIHTNTRVTNIMGGFLYFGKLYTNRFRKIQIINHVRDMDPLPNWKLALIGNCDRLIANSHQVKDFLAKNGVLPTKIEVVYNGVDTEVFNPAKFQKRAIGMVPVLGFIGQIYPRKGLNFLIESLIKVKEKFPNVLLRIVGQDPSQNQENIKHLQQFVTENNLVENVEWMGYLDYRTKIPEFLSRVDVFILPSLEEPFGRVVIDAMAMQRPVIASRVGGIPEIVVENTTGFLIEPADEAKLSEKIIDLLKNPDKSKQFGERGRKIVEERFSLTKHVNNIQDLYNRLLNAI